MVYGSLTLITELLIKAIKIVSSENGLTLKEVALLITGKGKMNSFSC